MTAQTKGLPMSLQARLVRHARATGLDPNLVLTRYGLERFLYRLSRSPHADRFVLKGALLMLVWLGETIRPTRDADLLGFGDISEQSLAMIFAEVCSVRVEPDGVEFLPSSVRVAPIREDDFYGGMRATLQGRLGTARLYVQVDVGIGDAVYPEAEWLEYPGLLDLPRPKLRAYRPETTIAEKLHAIVVLGEVNSRLRDFFDILALARHYRFDGDVLAASVRATFERRRTPVPASLPVALTRQFAAIPGKQAQWEAFLRKSGLSSVPAQLGEVTAQIASFVEPVMGAARDGRSLDLVWPPGGPWSREQPPEAR
ncbi:nucleotidyl transferase AbiEii/AbiGii toxin family protein [Pelomicrobium sp. G1]|uniref:nucleotidyl transferase AbiEii/AbiGii toxin family protein n=1 Tax=unclassified Pelomicrobium TaxID=2815318 RepID=UPI003F7726BE